MNPSAAADPVPGSVVGQTLVYRFSSGRTYQAAYGCDRVAFVLLAPALPEPPSKTMPYALRSLRRGLDLVVWDDPEFHTTFVIDLERGDVHASALRGEESAFLGRAEIVEVRATRDAAGSVIDCGASGRSSDG